MKNASTLLPVPGPDMTVVGLHNDFTDIEAQARRRSVSLPIFHSIMLAMPARTNRTQSDQKNESKAISVPRCSAKSKVMPGSFQRKSQGMMTRWAELEIGTNSVNPCTMPRITACSKVTGAPLVSQMGQAGIGFVDGLT